MKQLDPYGKLSPEDYLHLYWFAACSENMEEGYANFQPTESMIKEYNAFMQQWLKQFSEHPDRYQKAVDWDLDRSKTPYFLQKLQSGHVFEVWVDEEFRRNGVELHLFMDKNGQWTGENEFGLEIKHDMMLEKTGNLYIEYQERLKQTQKWVDSGILKEDNTRYWIIGSPKEYYIFQKQTLLSLYHKLLQANVVVDGCRFAEEKANRTSKGFLISREVAKEIALSQSIEQFVKETNTGKYYACGYYYHQNRQCKYISAKKDESLSVFSTQEEAERAGFRKCTNPACFEE